MNLTDFQHSPFLQSLGWAIANSLWQVAALWITYKLVTGIYKSASAKFKTNLSIILLFSSFVWFCITLLSKYFAIQNFGNYTVALYQSKFVTSDYNWNNLLNNIAWILPYLSVAYLLLLVFLSVRLINIYRFTGFIKCNGLQKPGVEWKLFTDKVAQHMGITKNIKLWVSRHIDVPATIGFLKPVILIPLASINHLSTHQMEAIILHELSHIKRNDYLINLFISIIETILFFNPFVVLLAKIIKRERENCCDDFVIQYQYDRHTYASALLSLEQYRSLNLKLAIGATSGKKQLLIRIKRIMEINNSANFNYGQKLAALLLITGVICSIAWLSPKNNYTSSNNVTIASVNAVKNKSDLKKIKKIDNFQALFENPILLNEKEVLLQNASKKISIKATNHLLNLKDINLKELAVLQSTRINLILEASKKQIGQKKLDKFNINPFFAKGSNFLPSLFVNKYTDIADGATVNHMNLFNQQVSIIEIKKMQQDLDKAGFHFNFNAAEIEDVIKHSLNSKEVKEAFNTKEFKELYNDRAIKATLKATEVKKDYETERVYRAQAKSNSEKDQRRFYVTHETKNSANGGTRLSAIYILDSSDLKDIALAEAITETEEKLYRTYSTAYARVLPDAKVYSYGFSVDDQVKHFHKTPNECDNTKSSCKRGNSKIVPAPAPYRINHTPVKNCPPVISTPPTRQTQQRKDIRVEYKNGIIVINGTELNMPENEIVAVSLKVKKILSKGKNLMNLHTEN